MREQIKKIHLIPASLVFIAMPLLFYALGDFPRRSVLKESISILMILAFFLMLGQFYLTRSTRNILKDFSVPKAIKIHKFIGYIIAVVILVHPFLIVLPRYFESGVAPMEAFTTIITTFGSLGIVLGIIAWCLMLLLIVTSIFRNKIGMKYKTWRIFHSILSILIITIGTWHAIDLGRHTDKAMSLYMVILAGGSVVLLLITYLFKSSKKNGGSVNG